MRAAAFKVAAIGVLAVAACTRPNPNICCASLADCDSIGIDDSMRSCSGGLVCVDHACVAPECEIDGDCNGATPFCAPEQVCVGCVTQAQCDATTPVCDPATRACVACNEDAECPSDACDFDTGACVAEIDVVYASPTGTDTSTCERTAPCSITRAFSIANVVRNHIKLEPGTYDASLVVAGKQLAVHGFDATITISTNTSTLTVNDSSRVRLFGLAIVNAYGGTGASYGLLCQRVAGGATPELSLDRITIDTQKVAMLVDQCNTTLSRSTVHSRAAIAGGGSTLIAAQGSTVSADRTRFDGGDGLDGFGGRIHVTKSVLVNQLGGSLGATSGGVVIVSFSTIANSHVNCMTTSACGATPTGACIDNSIIINALTGAPADTVTGTGCGISDTVVFPQSTVIPGANILLGMNPQLVDAANGDFHLQTNSPAVDAAGTASIAHDYDGTPRPQGTRSDLGAFELAP